MSEKKIFPSQKKKDPLDICRTIVYKNTCSKYKRNGALKQDNEEKRGENLAKITNNEEQNYYILNLLKCFHKPIDFH